MAEWDAAYINDLPDSAFAVILPGGEKDAEGKTVPRDLRKLPHHNAAGELDMPHLRNAMSRESQADMPEAMHNRAESHLQAHMDSQARSEGLTEEAETVEPAVPTEATDHVGNIALFPEQPEAEVRVDVTPAAPTDITVRSLAKREIDVRLLPWNTTVSTRVGAEEFAPGSFAHIPNDGLLLMGLEHEASFGIGQDGSMVPVRHPQGRSTRVWEGADGPYATFRVAKTQGGDDILALADDRVVRGVSIEMDPTKNVGEVVRRGGRRATRITRAAATAASLTYRPTYGEQAVVLAVRSQEQEAPMGDQDQEAPVAGAEDSRVLIEFLREQRNESRAWSDKLMERLDHLEERQRTDGIEMPSTRADDSGLSSGEWVSIALKAITGDRLGSEQLRALEQVRTIDDVVTTDNTGVVPPAYIQEVRGVIDTSRPFLNSTRRLETPAAGTQINVPIITQRPTTAVQSSEKQEVDSTKTIISSESFDMITIAGAGDLSIQIIKRSSPAFLGLWLELLAEAYAIDAETQALRALFDAIGGGITGATALDPENLLLGSAYQTSFDAIRRPPNTIWLSTEAVAKFIDAKATTTNAPLYPGLTPSATAGGGITGTISGLNAVHVPTLDAHGAFAVVGPSSGFAWAEDGTYELQVDVPSKAGRDVALVGMLWMVPWYPAAFTAYNVAS